MNFVPTIILPSFDKHCHCCYCRAEKDDHSLFLTNPIEDSIEDSILLRTPTSSFLDPLSLLMSEPTSKNGRCTGTANAVSPDLAGRNPPPAGRNPPPQNSASKKKKKRNKRKKNRNNNRSQNVAPPQVERQPARFVHVSPITEVTTVQQCSCCVFGDFHQTHSILIPFDSFHFVHCLFLLTIDNTSNEDKLILQNGKQTTLCGVC